MEKRTTEFRVAIRGIDLDEDTVARINKAVQAAVLDGLAGISAGTVAYHWPPRPLPGIWIDPIRPEQVEERMAEAQRG